MTVSNKSAVHVLPKAWIRFWNYPPTSWAMLCLSFNWRKVVGYPCWRADQSPKRNGNRSQRLDVGKLAAFVLSLHVQAQIQEPV